MTLLERFRLFFDFDISQAIFIGVISSILSSLIVLGLMYLTRPRIRISGFICENMLFGKQRFQFKFVNLTFSKIYDVRIMVSLITPYHLDNCRIEPVKMERDYISNVRSIYNGGQFKRYAIRLTTFINLNELWVNESSYIELEIIAKHGISGFSKVRIKKFKNKASALHEAQFASGTSLKILRLRK